MTDIHHLQRTIGNRATAHLLTSRDNQALHRDVDAESSATLSATRPNRTGLPDHIKTGVETLSGFSLDDVTVHYNSDAPPQIQAHAYTRGTNIYLAKGQEKHIAHEAWHVVQQKRGSVQATRKLMAERVSVNDERALEREADIMGARSVTLGDPRMGPTTPGFRSASTLRQGATGSGVVQGVFFVDIIGGDGQVEQVDLHSVNSIAELERLVWQMPDDELNDPDVRTIIQASYVILQSIEGERLGAKALSLAQAAKEAPAKWGSSLANTFKGLVGVGESGTEEERGSLTDDPSSKKRAQSRQLGSDLQSTAIDTMVGQGLSQGASLMLEHSVPGISMVVAAARSGQMIFRGQSAVSPIDLGRSAVAARAKAKGYEEIPDADPVSSHIREAIQVLAKGQSVRGGGTLGSAATGTAVGIGVGAALTAPIGAVPGAIVGAILGSITGLIASIGIEKGTRDLNAERNAVKTLAKVIQQSNHHKGRRVGPSRDRRVGYGSTDASTPIATSTTTKTTNAPQESRASSRASRHQGATASASYSYQNSPAPALDQLNIDALAAYSALLQLGVGEDTLRSLQGLEQVINAQLKID